ncbi:J domain-containing protein [Roseospira marina]|uniref:J domain-containing protein n=1 Tax=Roseospira marina TaxID=140057 RepID=A0A5M6ICP8_9PROT|nr:J domain-containing protein [Roseospira marina]KAA5606054.1 J domain-containing protein [Roseospira marina]MBB4313084.1 DnaJ-class molecular chaperone [Roseospira marina]MBB5086175.1 DnaJ-class molecular chaperone [Roseospira marina]
MKDPYTVLGVPHDASPDDIKRAYRSRARTMHPDVNTTDPKAEDRFKELNAAHDLLSDPTRRARYDRGEIDANGQERPFGFRSSGPRSGFGSNFRSGFGGGSRASASGSADDGFHFQFNDLFKGASSFDDIFARAQSAKRKAAGEGGDGADAKRGADSRYRLTVSFEDAALGASRTVTLANGKTLKVRVPAACVGGTTLRLRGQGTGSGISGNAGDALVEIVVRPHPVFSASGDDVIAEVPISLREAVLGGKITVPTVDGRVAVTVPEGSNTGATLRLRGKGLPRKDGALDARGDQLVRLRIVLEDPKDERLKAFVRKWTPTQDTDVRAGLENPAAEG